MRTAVFEFVEMPDNSVYDIVFIGLTGLTTDGSS